MYLFIIPAKRAHHLKQIITTTQKGENETTLSSMCPVYITETLTFLNDIDLTVNCSIIQLTD